MKKMLTALFAAAALVTVAAAAEAPATITLKAKQGDITFPHKAHADRIKDCKKCHATEEGGKIEGFGKEKGHALCQGCHKEQKKGPTKCVDCHKKKA